jgi:hypothetical protein
MSIRSKLVIATTVAMLGLASPAFAQSFDPDWGTGNSVSTFYDGQGALHVGSTASEQTQVAGRSGESAFAMIPNAISGIDNPSLTGGGSAGYNETVRTDY